MLEIPNLTLIVKYIINIKVFSRILSNFTQRRLYIQVLNKGLCDHEIRSGQIMSIYINSPVELSKLYISNNFAESYYYTGIEENILADIPEYYLSMTAFHKGISLEKYTYFIPNASIINTSKPFKLSLETNESYGDVHIKIICTA